MVALELAEEMIRRGAKVHLLSNEIDGELKDRLIEIGATFTENTADVDIFEFNLVWSQHHILPHLLLNAIEGGRKPTAWPMFVFCHLSPYDPAEVPGPFIERNIADMILANSPETVEKLRECGPPFDQAEVFPNPAPHDFSLARSKPKPELESLLVVSNHRNPEIKHALRKLARKGIRITRIGRRHSARRVTPQMIMDHDAVLTIGKTVQYALRAGRPVFCYDRFGGPGWLNSVNFERAAWHNFSGRDKQTKRSSEALCSEVIEGYREAREFAVKLERQGLLPYALEHHLDQILRIAQSLRETQSWYEERLELFMEPSFATMIRHETRIAEIYRKEFLHRRKAEAKKRYFRRFVSKLRRQGAKYFDNSF